MPVNLLRRSIAELLGTSFLLSAVVGSGIMAERLAGGNPGVALLANTLASGAALVALILAFGPISGAHFNPAVTLADASQGGLRWGEVPAYLAAQVAGGFAGVAAAHLMFGAPLFSPARHTRAGAAQLFSEFVATFGLLAIIWGCVRLERASVVPLAVGAYITSACWFTASTSFANPAVTLARAASDTYAGIRPADAPGFILAQLLGAAAATALFRWLIPSLPEVAASVVVPHAGHRRDETNGSMGNSPLPRRRVLILCTGNSARSQMAEGLLRHDGGERFEVVSAGTHPGAVRAEAIAAMREVGIDISHHRSKSVDEFAGREFDDVITVCDNAKENCPVLTARTRRTHWSFDDPAAAVGDWEARLAVFRRVRDELREQLRRWMSA